MRAAIRKPRLTAAALVACAAALATWLGGSSIRSAVELGRAREAAALSGRLRASLASLPSPPPRCAAACLIDDAPAAPGQEAIRLAGALAALPGEPAWEERAGRLAELVRAAVEGPAPRGPGAGSLRLEAEAILSRIDEEARLRTWQAGEALLSSLPWSMGAGAAGLALGLLSLGALARQLALRRRAEEGKAALLRAAEQVRDLVTIADGKGRIEYVNKAVEEVTGYSRRQLVGSRSDGWLPWYRGVPFLAEMQRTVRSGRQYRAGVLGRRRTGQAFLADETVTPLVGRAGVLQGIVSTARDVTEQRLLECTLDHRARHDPLTGLPNRAHLLRLLDRALRPDGREPRPAAVLVVDVDRFTQLNDLLGTAAGDRLLVELAQRLQAVAGERDLVARVGSDGFALVRLGGAGPVDAAAAAEEVRRAVAQVGSLADHLPLTVAVGIAMCPEHARDARSLLERADLALGEARRRGRGVAVRFDESLARGAAERFLMERRLAGALRGEEFLLRYQPYFDLASGSLAGAEALIAWRSPDLGTVPASHFVPLLEQSGMILEVGHWVLETACRQAREWEARALALPVSVNLSAAQFRDQRLVDMVAAAIGRHQLDPARLTLEVTESACLDDVDFAAGTLRRLKELGISISVDDFGTGYSSLSYLKRLPVDVIKIDMSFVREVARDQDTASIVSAITTLARSMHLATIAEGVETAEQRSVLHLLRCDMGQGFYFSPAVAPAELAGLLEGGGAPALA